MQTIKQRDPGVRTAKKAMRQLLLACVFAIGLAFSASAQAAGNYVQYNNFDPGQSARFLSVNKSARMVADNAVELRVNALHNKKASSYVAVFNIIQLGRTTEEANALLNNRLSAFTTAVKNLGVPAPDVYVDMVNFLPKYEIDASKKLFSKKNYTEVPKGFELQKNVHIRYTDPAILDKVVTAAAAQDIYDLVKVDYFDDSPTATYEELRRRSFEYLAKIREDFRGAGIELDSAYMIAAENTWVAFPGNRYESYQAYSTQSFEPIEKGATISTVDKPVSRFYNAVPSNDYDIIINPEVLEPAIQYSYNLVLRFTFAPPPKPAGKNYFLITPSGDVQPLKLD